MKRHVLSIVSYSLFLTLLFSCNNKSGPGDAYTLKMRLAPGDSFKQNVDMAMKMDFEMTGQKLEMTMDMKAATSFNVTNVSAESKDLSMTYRDMSINTEMKGMEEVNNMMKTNPYIKNVIGKSVTLRLNNKNEIIDVIGFEDAFINDSSNAATKNIMKEMFSKEKMNSLFSVMFQVYPDKPVSIGDTWEREIKTNMGGLDMKVAGKYKLVSVKDGVATVHMDGKYVADGQIAASGMNMKMDGTQSGEMALGISDGYMKDGQFKMDIDASMNMMGQNVPVKMKGNYVMKGD